MVFPPDGLPSQCSGSPNARPAPATQEGSAVAVKVKAWTSRAYKAKEKHDLKGAYVAPGLIDGHVHIESAMVSVPEFARAVVPHGTTTVIADPRDRKSVVWGKR